MVYIGKNKVETPIHNISIRKSVKTEVSDQFIDWAIENQKEDFIMGRDPVELAKRAKYKPPAMRVRDDCYTKKSPFHYNEVVQANI